LRLICCPDALTQIFGLPDAMPLAGLGVTRLALAQACALSRSTGTGAGG
jgi:hypothetical protein